MLIHCPKCDSRRINTRHYGRRTGSTIGALAGAASVAASIVRGAELGAMAGTVTGPVGTVVGSITGGIIGCLLGGATGGALGAKLGEVVDQNILNNYRCLDCGFAFCRHTHDPEPTSSGHLSTLPLELRLRDKSTTQSHRAPIYCVDLTIKTGMTMAEAITSAKAESELRRNSGFDQVALDEAARQGFAAGAFEESEEDGAAVVKEFYPDEFDSTAFGVFEGSQALGSGGHSAFPSKGIKPALADKLNQKAARLNGHGVAPSTYQSTRQVPQGRP